MRAVRFAVAFAVGASYLAASRMKLIGPPAHLQQLLFACLGALALAAPVSAQDVITFTDGRTATVNVVSVENGQAMFEIPGGRSGHRLTSIREVQKAPPPGFAAAVAAYEKEDYRTALPAAKKIASQFKGLPTSWARQATSMIGDIHAAQGNADKAIAAYEEFQKAYPGGGGGVSDVGVARVLVMRKDFAEAKKKLEPVVAEALQQRSAIGATALAYSQAFYLMGQVQESEGELVPALENYLRTATLFRQDRAAAAAAQARADALRKAHGVHVP